jgi:hypothetical protein
LVQGQAWRWVWISIFVAALLLPATALQIWPDKKCGPLCAVLLIGGLTLPGLNATACVSLSLLLWLFRSSFSIRMVATLRWIFLALLAALATWIVLQTWKTVWPAIHPAGALRNAPLHDFPAQKILAVLAVSLLWRGLRNRVDVRTPALLCAGLFVLSVLILPTAFKETRPFASAADIAEFSDWESVIPPTSTVLVTPARDVGSFVWFTLQRPNYLTVDQSAGVVFSRATALEVLRRSQVLLPVMDENWKIWTNLRADAVSGKHKVAPTRPLTAESLLRICADLQLGFVISPEHIGFDALTHHDAGPWKDWNLYDCRKVRPT